jgi:uncharacterized protein YecT (DUF1311 family)
MKKLVILALLPLLCSCAIYTAQRQTAKYPECANEQTQADFVRCVNEKYQADLSENWGIKVWDWKEAEKDKNK